jgi:WD40 repeat protein
LNSITQSAPTALLSLAFLDSGQGTARVLVAIDENGQLRAWELDDYQELPLRYQAPGFSAAINPAKSLLAYGAADGAVWVCQLDIYAATPCASPRLLRSNLSGVNLMAFSPDGNLLAASLTNGAIEIWRMDGSTLTGLPLRKHQAPIAAPLSSRVMQARSCFPAQVGQLPRLSMGRSHPSLFSSYCDDDTGYLRSRFEDSFDASILFSGDQDEASVCGIQKPCAWKGSLCSVRSRLSRRAWRSVRTVQRWRLSARMALRPWT